MILEPTPIGTPVPSNPDSPKLQSKPRSRGFFGGMSWKGDKSFPFGVIVGIAVTLLVSLLFFQAREADWQQKMKQGQGEVIPDLPANRR